jgi:hypothetical protein
MITKRAPSRCFSQPGVYSGSHRLEVCPAFPRAERAAARAACTRAESMYDCCTHCSPLHVPEGFAAQKREARVCARGGSVLGPAQWALEASRAVRGGRCARAHDGLIACAEQCSQPSGRPRSSSPRSTSRRLRPSSAGANLPRLLSLQRAAARRARTALACSVLAAIFNVSDDIRDSFLAAPGISASRTTLTTTLLHVSAPP